MKKILFFLSAFCAFFFTACFYKKTIDVSFENPIAIAPDIQWARIESPFVSYYKDCSFFSEVVASGRKGDIERVTGVQTVTENSITTRWYIFEKGCLEESSIKIFNNYLKAKGE